MKPPMTSDTTAADDQVALYFMSGTGNNFRASQWIAHEAADQGATVTLSPLEKAQPAQQLAA